MSVDPATTRRLLLAQGFGAALMLPAAARSAPRREGRAAATHPAPAAVGRAAPPAPLVVLDPGHGGKDPGAIGVSGTYEKHVALATGQELAAQLRRAGYRVHLTRETDDFIPLDDRVGIAQARAASLFVSMHADAIRDPAVNGASVYTLATTASDAQTAALAARENAADRYGLAPGGKLPPQVSQILASLVRHETRVGSARLQQSVVGTLGHDLKLLDNPARHAAFAVLKAADIPSVLVEMGFMSNRRDEAALRQAPYRARVAAALKRAVDAYFTTGAHLTRIAG